MKVLEKSEMKVITGNHAVSYGAKLARVEVIAAYPITPQTTIVELLSEMVAEGDLKARFITVESEHSAMAGCISASIAGARAFTATSSQGLALMHEMLHWAAGVRAPIVMANVNRALAAPWSIWTDQNDSLSQRDTGWMQLYAESNQEALDFVILGYKVAEQVLLPMMIVLDAFILSHTSEPVEIYPQEVVDAFLPPYQNPYALNFDNPQVIGGLADPQVYFEFRYKLQKAHERAIQVFKEEGQRFGELFGRTYDTLEPFMLEDAEEVLVTAGSTTSTARYAVQKLREKGHKVGLLKLRMFRPFPFEDIRQALRGRKKVGIIDRNLSYGHHGIFYQEIKSALYGQSGAPLLFGYVTGLGGRDIRAEDIEAIYEDLRSRTEPQEIIWKGVRL